MKKMCFVLIFVLLLLTSCSTSGDNMKLTDNAAMAENNLAKVIEAINQKNSKELKSLFSKNSLKDSHNIENTIENLFSYIDGNIKSYNWSDDMGGPIADTNYEQGEKNIELKSWFYVITDEEKYVFFILYYPIDEFDEDNIGIYSLRVVKQTDKDIHLTYWQDMKTPGIYLP